MLTDDSERIAAPPRVAESAKPKAQPPPVAKKPMGLMERITSEKKTSNGSGERGEQTYPVIVASFPGSPSFHIVSTRMTFDPAFYSGAVKGHTCTYCVARGWRESLGTRLL